jgi:hypothetical protein
VVQAPSDTTLKATKVDQNDHRNSVNFNSTNLTTADRRIWCHLINEDVSECDVRFVEGEHESSTPHARDPGAVMRNPRASPGIRVLNPPPVRTGGSSVHTHITMLKRWGSGMEWCAAWVGLKAYDVVSPSARRRSRTTGSTTPTRTYPWQSCFVTTWTTPATCTCAFSRTATEQAPHPLCLTHTHHNRLIQSHLNSQPGSNGFVECIAAHAFRSAGPESHPVCGAVLVMALVSHRLIERGPFRLTRPVYGLSGVHGWLRAGEDEDGSRA